MYFMILTPVKIKIKFKMNFNLNSNSYSNSNLTLNLNTTTCFLEFTNDLANKKIIHGLIREPALV